MSKEVYEWVKVFDGEDTNLPEMGVMTTWLESNVIVQGTLGMLDNREHIKWADGGGCYLYVLPVIKWLRKIDNPQLCQWVKTSDRNPSKDTNNTFTCIIEQRGDGKVTQKPAYGQWMYSQWLADDGWTVVEWLDEEVYDMGMNTPWPVHDAIERLITATEILLHKKDYDGPDYEEMEHSIKTAKQYLNSINKYHNGL